MSSWTIRAVPYRNVDLRVSGYWCVTDKICSFLISWNETYRYLEVGMYLISNCVCYSRAVLIGYFSASKLDISTCYPYNDSTWLQHMIVITTIKIVIVQNNLFNITVISSSLFVHASIIIVLTNLVLFPRSEEEREAVVKFIILENDPLKIQTGPSLWIRVISGIHLTLSYFVVPSVVVLFEHWIISTVICFTQFYI